MKKILTLVLALSVAGLTTTFAEDVKVIWEKECAKCHGKDGKGDTTMGKKLKVKDYTSAEEQKKFTDEEAIKITKEGKKQGSRTLMKGFEKTLSEEEIKALVKFVRDFAK